MDGSRFMSVGMGNQPSSHDADHLRTAFFPIYKPFIIKHMCTPHHHTSFVSVGAQLDRGILTSTSHLVAAHVSIPYIHTNDRSQRDPWIPVDKIATHPKRQGQRASSRQCPPSPHSSSSKSNTRGCLNPVFPHPVINF